MSSVRGVLHLNQIDAFAEWAAAFGWQREPTRGVYEVLRLRHPDERAPIVLYARDNPTTHATVPYDGQAWPLVKKFIRQKKASGSDPAATQRRNHL